MIIYLNLILTRSLRLERVTSSDFPWCIMTKQTPTKCCGKCCAKLGASQKF